MVETGSHNIVLPWDKATEEKEDEDTPGFMLPLMMVSLLLALVGASAFRRK